MKTRIKVGEKCYLAVCHESQPERTGVVLGRIVEDAATAMFPDAHYIIGDAGSLNGVWTSELVFDNPLAACTFCREFATTQAGAVAVMLHRWSVVTVGQMNHWQRIYANKSEYIA